MTVRNRKSEFNAKLGLRLANRASRKNKNWLDRLATRLLRNAINDPTGEADDFMKDELTDTGVEFDPADLEEFERGAKD